MKFGFSLESVNLLTSCPNYFYRNTKIFWQDLLKFIAAAGFKGIELPFNIFSSDAMAFEIGRCGNPNNQNVIKAKYGSYEGFLNYLHQVGIEEVTSVHISANDAMQELIAIDKPAEQYFELFEELCFSAVDHAKALNAGGLVISTTPEFGWVTKYFGEAGLQDFEEKTAGILNITVEKAKAAQIAVALKTDFWGVFRGPKMAALLNKVPGAMMCPDLAHLYIEEAPIIAVLDAHKAQLAYARLSDSAFKDEFENNKHINAEFPLKGAQKVFADLGEGKVNILGAVRTMKQNGYSGWLICEQKKTVDIYKALLKARWYLDHEIIGKLAGN